MTYFESERQEHDAYRNTQIHQCTIEHFIPSKWVLVAQPNLNEEWEDDEEHDQVTVVVGLGDVASDAQALLHAHGAE